MSKAPIDLMLDGIVWVPTGQTDGATGNGLPYATHSGVLHLFGHELRCYRLNTGDAVFNADDFEALWNGALAPEAEPVEGSSTPVQKPNKGSPASGVLNSESLGEQS